MTIYTQQIYNNAGGGSSGPGVIYTVPTSKLLILTDIDLLSIATASGQLSLIEIGAAVVRYWIAPGNAQDQFVWRGRQVLNPGQTIVFDSTCTAWYMGMTGYVLDL